MPLKALKALLMLVGIAVSAPAPSAALGITTQLTAHLVDDAGKAGGRILVSVEPRRKRLCFDLELPRVDGPVVGVLREASRSSGRRPMTLQLFNRAGGLGAKPLGHCRTTGERDPLKRIARNPHAFQVSIRQGDDEHATVHGGLEPSGRIEPSVNGFESGGFNVFDADEALNGSLAITSAEAYEGARAARASNAGGGNQYQRVQHRVDWREGADVWYGVALYIPRLADWCWWYAVRWDNFRLHRSAADLGGLRIQEGLLYVDAGTYSAQHPLIGPVAIPESRWFWVEAHQRFSGVAGEALTELYIDGRKIASSTAPNTAGRPITEIRYGNVAMESACSLPASIYFDRVSISAEPRGPRP
jgi:hypothetical protein